METNPAVSKEKWSMEKIMSMLHHIMETNPGVSKEKWSMKKIMSMLHRECE